MLIEPATPAEFRDLVLQALGVTDQLMLSVVEEVTDALTRVYRGEQEALSPCQQLLARSFFNVVQEHLRNEYEV